MRQFFKFIFASCLGTLLALALIIGIFMAIGVSSIPSSEVSKNAVLKLSFDDYIPELTGNLEQGGFSYSDSDFIGLNDIKRLIEEAANDSHIKGILIQTESPQLSPTSAKYVHDMIIEFKESGKFVHAYGNYFTQSGYMVALAADSIFLNPNGLVDMRGYGMSIPYFKNFSEKTGISFDVYHAGKYKSAIEPFYRSESSEENRYQSHQYLSAYQNSLVNLINKTRGIDLSDVERIIVDGLSQNADDAIELGLVDELVYFQDYEERVNKNFDLSKLNLVNLEDYYRAKPKSTADASNKIAVVYAEGEVAHLGKAKGSINMEVYGDILDRIRKNDKIKAVVLRVNSPGGSSLTSDLFWRKVEDLKKEGKYVVASYGDYAASGGYYISCGADKIVSEATTLTGSIGVFSMMPNMNRFFGDKLGINWDTIGTGNHTFLYSLMQTKSPADNKLLQGETERVYKQFKDKVKQGRGFSDEQIEEIAQGRVWSGIDALEVGLIDTIGSLEDAIHMAAAHLNMDTYKVLEYPIIKKTLMEELMTEFIRSAETKLKLAPSIPTSKITRELLKTMESIEAACAEPQARMPFHTRIY